MIEQASQKSECEASQKMFQTYSDSPYYKKLKKFAKIFKKFWESKKGMVTTAAVKQEVTSNTKNNDRGINDHNTTREIDLQ